MVEGGRCDKTVSAPLEADAGYPRSAEIINFELTVIARPISWVVSRAA